MKKFLFILFCFLIFCITFVVVGEINSPFSLRKVRDMEDDICKYCNVNIDFVVTKNTYNEYNRLVEEFTNQISSLGNIERDNMNVSEWWCNNVGYSEVQMEELEEVPF